MKKSLPAAAALALCATGSAMAQSSVTVYGVVDLGVAYNRAGPGNHTKLLTTGNLIGSRLGFRGTEDLGGGLKANFILEHGFSGDTGTTGQGNTMWGREASVGFSSNYGSVKLGRMYDPVAAMLGTFTAGNSGGHGSVPNWAGADGGHPGDIDNLGGTNRITNAVRYTTPDLSGFTGSAFYSLGEQAKDASSSIWTVAGTYTVGGLSIGLGYNDARDPNYSTWGDKSNSLTAASTPNSINMTGPVLSGFASAGRYKVAIAAVNYDFGPVTLGVVYSNTRFADLGAVAGNGLNPLNLKGTAKYDLGEFSAAWRIVPTFQVGVVYTRTKGNQVGPITGATYNTYELATEYVLSKRTDLYALAVRQNASGIDSTGKQAVAVINNIGTSKGPGATLFAVGIRHRF